MRRNLQSRYVYTALSVRFCDRRDVLLAGGGYLRANADSHDELLAPDWIIAFGVDPDAIIERNGYVISEVGKPPDLILDIAVQRPGPHDHNYETRRERYAKYGVHEFWYLDHHTWYSSKPNDVILTGDKLVNGEYAPIPITREPNGLIWGHSEVLSLDICWDSGKTRFRYPSTTEYLLDIIELKREMDALNTMKLEADAAKETAEAEIQRLRERTRWQMP